MTFRWHLLLGCLCTTSLGCASAGPDSTPAGEPDTSDHGSEVSASALHAPKRKFRRYGQVALNSFYSDQETSSVAAATFYDNWSFCKDEAQIRKHPQITLPGGGSCALLECNFESPGAKGIKAGNVTISGPGRTITLRPRATPDEFDSFYSWREFAREPFPFGSLVHFGIAGSSVVPPSAATLRYPSRAVLTSPKWNFEDAKKDAWDRDQPLTLRWRNQGNAPKDGTFFAVELVASGRVVECDFPASDGSGVVPPRALRWLPAGDADLALWTESERHRTQAPTDTEFLISLMVTRDLPGNPVGQGTLSLE